MADERRSRGDFSQVARRGVQAVTYDPEEERDREEVGLDPLDFDLYGDVSDALREHRRKLLAEVRESSDRVRAALDDSLRRAGGGPNTRAYLKNRPKADTAEAEADRASARAAIARADAGDINDSSAFLYALREERQAERRLPESELDR